VHCVSTISYDDDFSRLFVLVVCISYARQRMIAAYMRVRSNLSYLTPHQAYNMRAVYGRQSY